MSHIPSGYASYEIIIPRQLSVRAGKATRDQISYVVEAEGNAYIVHLKLKDILVKRFPVFMYHDGKLQQDSHEIQGDCYYRGYVEDAAVSFVSLRACSGLSGLLQIENLTYNIDPMEGSSTFQHLIYRTEEEDSNSRTCGLSGKRVHHSVPDLVREPISEVEDTFHPQRHPKYMELFVQVDVHLFRFYSSDVRTTIRNVVHLNEMVDDMFVTLGLRTLLVGVEIWTEKNLVPITDYIQDSVEHFNAWRVVNVLPRLRHDASLLLARHSRGSSIVKYSYFGTVCKVNAGVAFVSVGNVTFPLFALGIAHELGHVLGIPDDLSPTCSCAPQLRCIMNPTGPYGDTPLFSNCSATSYFEAIHSGKGLCMTAIPDISQIFALSHCGNGIVEGKEECDCGEKQRCKKSKCCLDDCTMAPGAECTTQVCCRDCQFAPEGTLCRKASDECDLPEYCNGTTADCSPDVLVQDGTLCSDDGYCILGTCSTHTLQCQKLFGQQSAGAPLACFERVNTVGDRFGNCAGDGEHQLPPNFSKCARENALCGRVQCVNVHTLPNMEDHMTIIQTPVGKTLCWGMDFHPGTDVADFGVVEEGSKCGRDKICVRNKCTRLEAWVSPNAACHPVATCGGNGVCNSKQHCHCRYGWAPPMCRSPGWGGSIDSGPLPRAQAYSRPTLIVGVIVAAFLGSAAGCLIIWVLRKLPLVSAHPTPKPQGETTSSVLSPGV